MAVRRKFDEDRALIKAPWYTVASGISSLSQEDRRHIRMGFDHFNKNKLANGARFFAKFFKNNPTYQDLFPALHGVSPEEIASHQFLLCVHVERFFLIFEEFLSNMYNAEGLHSAVYGMLNSKSHVKSNIQPIHCQNMLTALLETIVEILKEDKAWSLEMEISWKKFMAVLLEIIREEISDADKIKHVNH